ncbi:MAG: nucleotidyltransferase domain-containing protein [Acidimicrobiia bacterium]
MDVAVPLRSVVPTLDGPVVAVLAATTAPLSLAEVHRRAGDGSKSGIRRVLLRLTGEGLVHEVPGGYVLNREHLAAPAVELLANLHGELMARIRREVEAWSPGPLLVGLFGSAARRDGDATSDIDVVVISDDAGSEDVDRLRERIKAWTGNTAQIIALTLADLRRLRRAKEPILAVWDRELVVIAGDRRALHRPR